MKEEGVIKFKLTWKREPALPSEQISSLNAWRDALYDIGLIGGDKKGIGYGNISMRLDQKTFLITGSGTGALKKLTPDHYTKVTSYNLTKNTLVSAGPIKASSESMTHAAVYTTLPGCNAVFHIHHLLLWQNLIDNLPSTPGHIEYGTPAMASAIIHLLRDPQVLSEGILAMGGHQAGIIAFGKNLDQPGAAIGRWLAKTQ